MNTDIRKNEACVVEKYGIPDLEDLLKENNGAVALCRCWKSKKFPLCDGSHRVWVSCEANLDRINVYVFRRTKKLVTMLVQLLFQQAVPKRHSPEAYNATLE